MNTDKTLKTFSAIALAVALGIGIAPTATAADLSPKLASIQIKTDYKSNLRSYKAQLAKLAGAEAEIINGWSSVSGENYTTDAVMYAKLKVLLPKISKFIRSIEAIKPKDSKIYKAHAVYVSGWNLQFQGFTMTLAALETQDYSKVTAANGYLAQGRAKIAAFTQTLSKL